MKLKEALNKRNFEVIIVNGEVYRINEVQFSTEELESEVESHVTTNPDTWDENYGKQTEVFSAIIDGNRILF